MFHPYTGPTKKRPKVAISLFSVEPRTGRTYFAFARKVPPEGRVNWQGFLAGAAGTDSKYHGKWVSFGGTPSQKANYPLKAAIMELNDEAGMNINSRTVNVHGRSNQFSPIGVLSFQSLPGLDYFIMEMNWNLFSQTFPDHFVHNSHLIHSSHGEIDSIRRFHTEEIFARQYAEMNMYGNNFFTGYVLDSFVKITMPFICRINRAYDNKWGQFSPTRNLPDTIPRYLTNPQCQE
jgi:hypothetical protein